MNANFPCRCAAEGGIVIRSAEESDRARWDAFVLEHPEGTLFHRFGWREVLSRAFRHPVHYLIAERNGALAGLLPLVHKRSRLFGDGLISTPYCSYGGVLAEDEGVARALEDEAEALGRKLNVGAVELRNRRPRRDDWVRVSSIYASFRRPLPESDEALIRSVSSKGRRHELKKSMRRDLSFSVVQDVERFYGLLSESYRNLGTPIFSKRYFALVHEMFQGDVEVHLVSDGSGPLTGSMAFFFREDVHPIYTGGGHRARLTQANDFLYLKMMARARERGARVFDFGRSKVGTGAYDNKQHWGFRPEPLHYEYKLITRADPPNLNPLNPKYRLMVETWKRLPLGLSRLLGPLLGPHLG
jgi:FemAB-related protein (PEP-CTERM system-associated)